MNLMSYFSLHLCCLCNRIFLFQFCLLVVFVIVIVCVVCFALLSVLFLRSLLAWAQAHCSLSVQLSNFLQCQVITPTINKRIHTYIHTALFIDHFFVFSWPKILLLLLLLFSYYTYVLSQLFIFFCQLLAAIFGTVQYFFLFVPAACFLFLIFFVFFSVFFNVFQQKTLFFFYLLGRFWRLQLPVHHRKASILKFKMLIFCSPLLSSICLFLSSIKFMLKFRRLLKDSVLNEKHKCSLLFVCSCSAKGALNHYDFPFISSQLLILFVQIYYPQDIAHFSVYRRNFPVIQFSADDKNLFFIVCYQ